MDEQKRNDINAETAMAGEAPYRLGELKVRRLSLESMHALERMGSPFAADFTAALNGTPAAKHAVSIEDLLLFAWAHAEDQDVVLDISLQCTPVYTTPAVEAASRFARRYLMEPQMIAEVTQYITGQREALESAAFRSHAPDVGGDKKKE